MPPPPSSEAADAKVLKSAPPPLHTKLLVVFLIIFFCFTFPSLESIDEKATIQTFTNVLFPDLFSVSTLAYTRLFIAFVFFYDLAYGVLFITVTIDTVYSPESKLRSTKLQFRGLLVKSIEPHDLVGFMTLSFFTRWAFMMLTVAFFLSGLVPLLVLHDITPPIWLLRLALLTFECAAPTTLLVSSIMRYVIWTIYLKSGKDTLPFRSPRALMEHNGNVISALLEIGLLGGLPVRLQDFSVAPLFGLVYVLFSWHMTNKWAHPSMGPQFLYNILDTTLGWKTSIALLGLLVVLTISFAFFSFLDNWIVAHHEHPIHVNLAIVVVVASCVCRFRD